MFRKWVPYCLLIACILIIVLLVLPKDKKQEETPVEIEEPVICSGEGLRIRYENNEILINQGKLDILLHNIDGEVIPTNGYEEFCDMLYIPVNYEIITRMDGEKKIWDCYIESYDNLITALGNTPNYNKEKFKKYYLRDVDIKPVEKKVSLASQYISRQDLVNNFKGHEQEIVSGKMYFRVDERGEIFSFDCLVDLEDYLSDSNNYYDKAFELTPEGSLKGYTFTVVYD